MRCSKGVILLIVVIVLCAVAIISFQFGFSHINVPHGLADKKFKEFIKKYNRSYGEDPQEYQKRFNIFMTHMKNNIANNMQRDNFTQAEFGVTNFTDLTETEFRMHYLNPNVGFVMKLTRNVNKTFDLNKYRSFYDYPNNTNFSDLPQHIDWREKNNVSPVRKQGVCGGCWAYSVASTIESNLNIHKGLRKTLSVQQMIDCAANGNNGCAGGDTCLLLQWLKKEKVPILTEDEYPINSDQNSTCKNSVHADQHYVRVMNYTCDSFVNNEDKLLEILTYYGPVTVAVNAALWQNYLGGIIQYHCDGSIENLNHAVEIIGYDRSGDVPYYIVKNSWGTQYGDKGYMRIAIGRNLCGIANQVSLIKADEF